MAKIPYLQFWRVLLVLAALAGFGTSSLIACRCAPKKKDNAGISFSKAGNKTARNCCKKPVRKPAEKVCCKMICCMIDRKQEGLVENNQPKAAEAIDCSYRSFYEHNLTISNKPFYQSSAVKPGTVELCVFLC